MFKHLNDKINNCKVYQSSFMRIEQLITLTWAVELLSLVIQNIIQNSNANIFNLSKQLQINSYSYSLDNESYLQHNFNIFYSYFSLPLSVLIFYYYIFLEFDDYKNLEFYQFNYKTITMGCANPVQVSEASQFLTVATLNYSGILNSPYEFYSQDNQKEQKNLSQIFKNLIPKYFPDFDQKIFKWNVGKIDQKMQKERYSPSYRPDVGIQNNTFISKQRFQQLWNATFQKQIKNIQLSYTPQERHRMMLFDLITYHALLKQIYKIEEIQQALHMDIKQYVNHNNLYFKKSYLSNDKKQEKVIRALEVYNADIFCFQEPTAQFIDQALKNNKYQIAFNQKDKTTSVIIVKKSKFKTFHKNADKLKLFSSQQIKGLNWDNDTSYMFVDNIVIFSTHLTSKKDKNAIQVQQLKASLKLLRQKYPFLNIIVCGDMNSCIQHIEGFNIYPNDKRQFTNAKKRTMIQPQFNKGDLMSKQIKDQIVTTFQIQRKRITTILNKNREQATLIPAEEHPFDHFLVQCTIKTPSLEGQVQKQNKNPPLVHPVN